MLSLTTDTLSGGVLTVNFNSSDNVTITSSGGRVLVNGANPTTGSATASSVTAINITGTGNFDNTIDLSGVGNTHGFTSLATVAINVGGSSSGDQVNLGTLNASGLVSVTGSGTDALNTPASLVAGSVSITAAAISLASVTTTGNQVYNGPVTLAADATIAAGSGNVTFNGTLDGADNLTVDSAGVTTFGGTVGGNTAISSLTTDAAGSTVLDASVNTGGLTFNDPVTLGNNVTLSAGLGTVTLHAVNGPYSLTFDTWNLALDGSIGVTTPLASLSANIPFNFTFAGGSIITTGPQTYGGDMVISGDATLNSGAGDLDLAGIDGPHNVALVSSGLISISGLGGNTPLASLTTSAAGMTSLNGSVNTTGNQTYNNPVSLGGSSAANAGSGNVTFASTVDSGGLTVNTTGQTTFDGAVGKTNVLGGLTISAGGTTVLAGGTIATTFSITFGGPVVLASNMIIGNGGFSINFDGTVNGDYSLTLPSSGLPGTTFAAAVGGTTPLASISTAGGTVSLQNVTTIGSQNYNDSVKLDGVYNAGAGQFSVEGGATLLGATSIDAGSIALATVDGAYALSTSSSGAVTLAGKIGGSTPLASLAAISSSGVGLEASITTSGNQTYSQPTTIAAAATLKSTGGSVAFVAANGTTPALTPVVPALAPVAANAAGSSSTVVSGLVGSPSVFNNPVDGIAVTSVSSPGGSWQYSTNGTSWTNFGTVSSTQSLLLAANDLVRFAPDGTDTGTASFTYLAWNQTGGTSGTTVNTTVNGTGTPFSTASQTASIIVQVAAVITTDTFSGGTLTVNVSGAQNVTISSSGGNLLVNGANPTTGAAPASAVTTIDVNATAGNYDNVFDLTGVSAATGFTSLAAVSINTGGSYFGDQVKLGTLNASGALSVTGTGSDAVTTPASLVAGSVSITATTLSLGSVTTTGNQTYGAAVTLAGSVTLSAGSGNITFNGAINSGGLTTNTTGTTTFNGPIGETNALAGLLTDAGGTIVLAGGSISTSFGTTFNNPVVLGSALAIDNGGVQFNSTVDGAYSLTLIQGATFNGAVGSATPLASFVANGPTISLQSVFTTGPQTYDDYSVQLDGLYSVSNGALSIGRDATLLGNTAISANSVSLEGVDGAYGLNIVAGGIATLAGTIGGATPLSSITVNSSGGIDIDSNVTTTGNQIYQLPVTVASGATLTSTAGVVSNVATIGTAPVLAPMAPLLSAVIVNQATSSVESVASMIGSSITDDNGQYGIAVNGQSSPGGSWQYSLGGTTWTDFGAVSAPQSLLLASSDLLRFMPDGSDTGTASFTYRAWNQATGTPGAMANSSSNGGNTAFSAATNTTSIAVQIVPIVTTDTFSAGVLTVDVDGSQNVAITSSGGNVLVNGANPTTGVAAANSVTAINVIATAGNYDNIFNLTGVSASAGFASLATVSINAGGSYYGDQVMLGELDASGLVSITGSGSDAVTLPTKLVAGSLSITANTVSLQSVITTGTQTYNAAITLAGNATLSAGSGNITFAGTLDGGGNLTVDSSGVTTFGGTVGGKTAPASVTTDSAGSTVLDASVTSGSFGGMAFNDPVTLGANVTLSAGTGLVTMHAVDGPYSLTFDTWSLALDGSIGANTPLASINANIPFNFGFAGGSISSTGPQNYGGDMVIGSDTTFNAGTAAIEIAGLDGPYSVVFDSSGLISLSNLGSNTPLASVTTNAAGTTSLGNASTTGNQTYNNPVSLVGTTINAGSGNVTFASTVDGGALTINTTGQTIFDGTVGATNWLNSLTISAGELTVLAGGLINTNSGITFGSPVVLESNTTIGTSGYNINFDGTVNGDYSLTISPNPWQATTFAAAVGGSIPLASFTSASAAISLQSVTTVGAQTYGDRSVQLDGVITTTNGALSISNSTTLLGNSAINVSGAVNLGQVDGTFALNVVGGGLTTLGGPIGSNQPLASLSISSSGGEAINANVTTSGNQLYTLPVTVASGVTLTSTAGTVSKVSSIGTAPVLTPIAPTFSPVIENQPSSAVESVATIIGDSITDDNLEFGIAVTGSSSPGGSWQYSLDGVNWSSFPAVSSTQSLLLAAADQVRFIPDGVDTGTATFTYRAWNQSSGTAGALVSTTTSGGNTAFSTATDTASIVIQILAKVTTDAFASGVLTVDVDGSQNVTVTTSGGDVLVNGANPTTGAVSASAVTAIDVTATSGTYDKVIDLTGVSAATGFTALQTVAVDAGGSYSSDQVNLGALNASGLVSITGSGNDAVTLPASLVAGSVSIMATAVSLANVTTTGNQTYGGSITLAADATLSAADGNITFNGTLDGAHNLTVTSSGVTTFGGAIGGSTGLDSFTSNAAGGTVLDASVTNNNDTGLTFNDPVVLGGNVTLTSGGAVTLQAVNGPYSLTLDSWDVQLDGLIGANTPLAALVASNASLIDFIGGSIITSGAQTYSAAIDIEGDTTLNSGSGSLQVAGINGPYNVVLDSSGLTSISSLGRNWALASVTTGAAGTTDLSGDVTTTGNQTYNNPVTLGGSPTLNAGSGNITFNSTVDSGGLTVDTTGTATFNRAVGKTNWLGSLATSNGGTTVLAGGSINATFGITFGNPVVLGSDMTIGTGGFSIDFEKTVDGDYNLTLGSSGFPGTTFEAAVGGITPLASLTSNSSSLSIKNVTTVGAQTYNDQNLQIDGVETTTTGAFSIDGTATLLGNSVINAGGAVTLDQANGMFGLNIISSGLTALDAPIGSNQMLTSLSVSSTGGVAINANVTTSGNQIYTLPVTVANGVTLSSFAGTVSKVSSIGIAPVLTPAAPAFAPVEADQASGEVATVALVVGSSITDDNDSYNIAVTADSSPGGTWQYSLDGVNWSNFPAVSSTQSLLLAAADQARFVPDGVDTGTATFTYRGWNLSSGTAGTFANTSTNGGNTAFSTATDTASIAIQINQAVTTDTLIGGVLTVNVEGSQNVTISSSGGNLLVNGSNPTTGAALASDVTAIDITAASGAYDKVFDLTGVSAATGFTSLATVAINVGGSYSIDEVDLGLLNASGLVSITGNGNDAVNAPAGLVAGSVSIAATLINLASVTTTGNQTYNGSVTLSADATISTGNGNVTFGGTLNGAYNLTVYSSGVTTFGGTVGGITALASLTTDASGSTVLDASVTTSNSGGLTFNDPVILGGNVTLAASVYTVTMNAVDGPYSLTFDTWNLALDGSIGATTPLASLSANIPFNFTFAGGSIITTGPQTYGGNITIGGDTTFNAGSNTIQLPSIDGSYNIVVDSPVSLGGTTIDAGSGNVTFASTVDGGGLTVNTTGQTTFDGAVGKTNWLNDLTIGPGGSTVLAGGSINTTFGITFGSPVVLGSNMTIGTAGFSIDFDGTVDGDYSLTMGASGFPGTTFAAPVGGLTPLASLTSAGGTLSIGNITTVGAQTYSDQSVQLDGIEQSTGGAISITNSATLLGNTVINASGAVNLNQVDGKFALNIVSGASTTLAGQIGQTAPPTNLTVSSAAGESILGSVTTSGNQTYTLPVTLASGVKLTSTTGRVSEISSVNTAPVLALSSPSLAPVVTTQAASTPITVAAIVGNSITDNNRSYNIAVTGQSTPGGSWQYSLDGTNWTNFGTVSGTQSLLLAASDEVRFAPDGVDSGTATFTYRAWSMTTGTARTYADTSANGGNTAFSMATNSASILIQIAAVVTADTFSGGVLTVNVDGGQNVTITSSGGDVLVNGANPTTGSALASAVTAIDITATAGNYDNIIDLTGVSNSAGFSSLATVTVNTGGSYAGDQVKLGTLNASGLVWISGSGSDTVTAPSSLVAGVLSIAATAINLNSVTTSGNQIYTGAVTLSSNATISSGSGNVTFNGTLDGNYTLAVDSSGVTTFGGTVGGNVALQSLTTDAAGSTTIDASITTNGNLNINDPLTLGGNATLGAGVNTVNINNTIDGAYALTINTWDMALTGAIGSTTPLASLTVNVPFNSTFSGGSITTTGAQSYSGLSLGSDTTFNAGSAGIDIGGLNGAYNVTLNSSGVTTLSGNIGGSMALASLTTDEGTTGLTGNVNTTGNQTYNNPVSLGAFSTLNAGSGNVTFNSTVDNGGLTVNTTGTTTFNAAVGGTDSLGGITIGAGGTTVLAGGSINTTFGMTFNSPVLLGSNMVIASAGFAIDFGSTINGDFNLTVGPSGFPGTTFAAAVGGLVPLASLTITGGTLWSQNITTVGSQTYNAGVELSGVYTATAGSFSVSGSTSLVGNSVINAGGAVSLNQVNGRYGLNIVSGATTTLGGPIGNVALPTVLMVSSAGGENINANVVTSGNQVYTLPVQLAQGVSLTSTGGTVSEIAALGSAPVLTPIAPVLPPVTVNLPASAATTVAALVGNSITDFNHSYNIAITGQSTPGGIWQYSLDGLTWTNVGTVSGTSALLLASSDLVRFAPDAVDTGTATLTYRAWNMASGTAGTYLDTSINGGNSPFSTATDTASILIQVAQAIITDTFAAGVLTVSVAGSQNITISSSGGDVLVNGASPTTGTALVSAVTAINITAATGAYNNVIDLTGVSASAGFSSLATVTVNTGGSYSSDDVILGTLNASGLVSITGSGSDAVTTSGSLAAGSLAITATSITLTSVTTAGSQTYNGAVFLAGNTTISSGSSSVTFNGTVDGRFNLAVDSSGVTTFDGTVGGMTALASLTTDAAGQTVLDASVTTGGSLNINDPLTLDGNVTLGAGINTVNINNTIDGAYALTINTWNMSLTGAIGSITPLVSLTVSVPFNSTFSGGSITTTGAQTYDTSLTLGSNTTFNAGSSTITVDGLNGAYNVTFDSSGLTNLSGNLGNSIALASVTTDAAGTTDINGDVTTSGNQTYNDPVSLWAFTTLGAGSGNITFNNTVDSGGLTVNTTGTTTFNGAVGENARLGSLSIGAGGTTVLAGGSINVTFGITFNSPIVLGSNMSIANAGFAIEFESTVDGDFNLSIGTSGFPGTTFAAAVGGLTPPASLTSDGGTLSLANVTTVGAQTYNDRAVQLDGIEESTGGAISITNAATLLGNTVINAAGAVNVGQVDGNFGLNVVSGALATLAGPIGQVTPLASLTVSSIDGVDIDANVTTSGNQIYTLPVLVATGANLTSKGGTVTESPAVDTAPVLTPITPTLAPITVNAGTSSAVPVSTMVGNSITDDNRVYQIAVVGQSSAAGYWQYSLDNGTTWTNFGNVSVSQALLLDSNDLVQFVPAAGNTQTASFTYRAWDPANETPGIVGDTSNNGGDTPFSTATDTASVTVDPAPTVMGAFVSSTAWAASYLSVLDAAGLGSSAASGQGFELPTGSDQLATNVSWTNINEISIAFSGPVNVTSTALTLYNSSNTAITPSGFSYNSTSNIATWEFASSLAAGKYVMNLAATSVSDSQGTELAGQWTTGTSTFAAGSGNGVAGEDFNFYFDVLPGDANNSGSVTNGDVLITKLQVGAVSTSSNYKLDVNASGNITNGDVLLEKLQVGSNINSFSSPNLPPESNSLPAVASASQSAMADTGSGVAVMAPADADAAPASAPTFAIQPALAAQPDTMTVLDPAADVGDPVAGSLQLPVGTDPTAATVPQPAALLPAVTMVIAATMPLLVADNPVVTSEALATPALIGALPTTDGADALVAPSIVVADLLSASVSLPSEAGSSSALAPATAGKAFASPVSSAVLSAVFASLADQPQTRVVLEPELLAALPATSTSSVPAALPAAFDRAHSAATSANLPQTAATAHARSLDIARDLLRSRWSSLGGKTCWPARGP